MLEIQKKVVEKVKERKEGYSVLKKKILLEELKKIANKVEKIQKKIFKLELIGDSFPYLVEELSKAKSEASCFKMEEAYHSPKNKEDFSQCKAYLVRQEIRMEKIYEKAFSLILRESCLIVNNGKGTILKLDESEFYWENHSLELDKIIIHLHEDGRVSRPRKSGMVGGNPSTFLMEYGEINEALKRRIRMEIEEEC